MKTCSLILLVVLSLLSGCVTMVRQRERFVSTHTELTEAERSAILRGEIIGGMSEDMVLASWGEPLDVISEVQEGRNVTSWIYQQDTGSYIHTYRVEFEYGEVQEVRLLSASERRYAPYYRRHNRRIYPYK